MAHMIDETTGRAAMAYTGLTPWHGLGQRIDGDASVEEWRTAAGLNWTAERAEVKFAVGDGFDADLMTFEDKHVLFRSDTRKPLSVVSSSYRIVQPADVLDFFRNMTERGHGKIETVGALSEGRRIWALARLGENARVMDDEVAPYLMLATSFDGSLATIAQFTSVRVVCNNTLQASLQNGAGQNRISVSHSAFFNPASVKSDLGLRVEAWEKFVADANTMAARKLSDSEADAYILDLFAPFAPAGFDYTPETARRSKGYRRVMELFAGGQIGAGQDAIDRSAWGMLNAVTEFIDHHKGRSQDNRLDGAWFGEGTRVKARALELAGKLAA